MYLGFGDLVIFLLLCSALFTKDVPLVWLAAAYRDMSVGEWMEVDVPGGNHAKGSRRAAP
jgi:hypothetical protein